MCLGLLPQCMLGGYLLQLSSILLHVELIFYSFLFLIVFCIHSSLKSVRVVFLFQGGATISYQFPPPGSIR